VLGGPLLVAVVHPAPAAIGPARVDAEWIADRHRVAQAILDGARAELADVTGPVEYRAVASSSAAHGLHDLAEQTGASAIAVGSGRHGPQQRLFVGSTADRLLAGSVCPIAVAPAGMQVPPGALGRIGVAFVDTPDGRAALDTAVRLARRTGTPLRLCTVVADEPASLPFLVGEDSEHAFLATAREAYEQSLEAAAATAEGVTVDWEIRSGEVVESLAELDDVDVLFCGSRGYGPARRVLLGGVSARLLRRARRPIVVVPRSG
jgi:nucleotide-binding universal stress UspA family protein